MQPAQMILDLIQLKRNFDSSVKYLIKNKNTTDKAGQWWQHVLPIAQWPPGRAKAASQVHSQAKKSKQLRNRVGAWYTSNTAQERTEAPGLSLSGLLGPWVGWAETPGEAGQGHQDLWVL